MSATIVSASPLDGQQLPSAMLPVIAVLIPCYNEAAAIGSVVRNFRAALPTAAIFVYDNNSTDETAEVARRAGAVVRHEKQRGKGNVVRRMFADVEADIFVLVDGDDTYDASCAGMLIDRLLKDSLDMVNAARTAQSHGAYRPGHRFGNLFLTGCVSYVFGNQLSDMLSGYRVFSRRFVKSFPALSAGFEIETELTVHALELRLPIAEVPTSYGERPQGSASKLNTYRDGVRILLTIVNLIKLEKPLQFFGGIFALLALASVVIEIPVLTTYLKTGLVPRLPTAVLGTGIMLLAFLSLVCGLILETVTRGRIELKRLHYLAVPLRFNNVGAGLGPLRAEP
jgi:glycosyltransferase involved in cell wall biosynthesis